MKTQTIKINFILLFTLSLCLTTNVKAQTPDHKWGVGFLGGSEQYNGEYGNGFYDFDQAFYGFMGFSVSRLITDNLDVTMNTTLGEMGYIQDFYDKFQFRVLMVNVNLKYNFFQYRNVKFRPFLYAGIGYMQFYDKRSNRVFQSAQLPDLGVGLTYSVLPFLNIVLQETFIYSDSDQLDYISTGPNDMFLQHTLGVVYNFGGIKSESYDWKGMWKGKSKHKTKKRK